MKTTRRKFLRETAIGSTGILLGGIGLSCNSCKGGLKNKEKKPLILLSEIDAKADALKQKILNSATQITVTGTSYYVSNKGDDSNDGKSPGKAWATLSKVSEVDLSNGDAVLFERGGMWRGMIFTKGGVSYSAYGSGDKPKIIGSLQNHSVKQKWILTGTQNVYVYDQELNNDAGLLVFNHGEAYTFKKLRGVDGFSGSPGELRNDLEMCHSMDEKKYISILIRAILPTVFLPLSFA